MLLSAFENWKDRCDRTICDEATLASIQKDVPGIESSGLDNITYGEPTEAVNSGQSISPFIEPSSNTNNTPVQQVLCQGNGLATNSSIQVDVLGCDLTISENISPGDLCEPRTSGQDVNPNIGPSGNANDAIMHQDLDDLFSDNTDWSAMHNLLEYFGINKKGLSQTLGDESQQSNAIRPILVRTLLVGCITIRWKFQARKKRKNFLGQREMDIAKRHRIE